MRRSLQLMLITCAAAGLLALAVGSSSARSLSVNEQSDRIVWTPIEFIAGANSVRCNLTLEGSFHYRVSAKTVGSLSGFITRAIVNTCTGGSVTVLVPTFPWHTVYRGFTGTLPNITGVRLDLVGFAFSVRPTGLVACLARSTTENPGRGIVNISRGTATSIRSDETATIPLNGFLCEFAGEGSFSGTATITKLGGGSLTVTLI